jgi:pimeloyl-ACP methyl ester carboxylesterase
MVKTLLLPGLICNETIWEFQVQEFGTERMSVAHGYRLCRSLQDMARTVLSQAPDTFNVCGHSMGARVALEVYRQAPHRVKKLALLDTGIHPVQPGEKEKRIKLLDYGKRCGMKALVDLWLPPMVATDNRDNSDIMDKMHTMACDGGLDGFEAQITALLARPEVESLLPEIKIPTLVGVGELDEWSPPEQHEHISSLVPNSDLVIFEGAGHMAPMERPNLVNDALSDWLES